MGCVWLRSSLIVSRLSPKWICAHVDVQVVEHPLKNVAHRQEAQHAVVHVGVHRRHARLGDEHVARHVVVGQHHALGKARRSRRVDDGRELGRIHRIATGFELRLLGVRAGLGDFGPVACPLHILKREHFFQGGAFGLDRHDLVVKLLAADKAVLRFAVVEDVLVILFRHRGVDRNVDGARLHDGVVHDVPLAAVVVADQGHFFLGLKPHGNEAA